MPAIGEPNNRLRTRELTPIGENPSLEWPMDHTAAEGDHMKHHLEQGSLLISWPSCQGNVLVDWRREIGHNFHSHNHHSPHNPHIRSSHPDHNHNIDYKENNRLVLVQVIVV